ncbi:MAG: hypothetical protein ACO1OB_02550 [Archangium sp.]
MSSSRAARRALAALLVIGVVGSCIALLVWRARARLDARPQERFALPEPL